MGCFGVASLNSRGVAGWDGMCFLLWKTVVILLIVLTEAANFCFLSIPRNNINNNNNIS